MKWKWNKFEKCGGDEYLEETKIKKGGDKCLKIGWRGMKCKWLKFANLFSTFEKCISNKQIH